MFRIRMVGHVVNIPYRFLQSVEGGSKSAAATKQEVVDLAKYLYLADSNTCDLDNVTRMPNIVKYLNELRSCGVGPSGQITKLQTLLNAIKMMVMSVPDDGGDEATKDVVVRAKVIETRVKGISKSLRKECSLIRLQKRDMFDGGSDLRDKVLEFLDNQHLMEVVSSYVAKEQMDEGERLLTRRFLMCSLMFKNAQREGPVVNLRLGEVRRALCHKTQAGDNVYVYKVWPLIYCYYVELLDSASIFPLFIQVWQHKTAGQFGSANLVLPEAHHHLVSEYIRKHRPAAAAGCEDFVFLTPLGKQVAHISDDLRALSTDFRTPTGVLKVTSTDMRKLTCTNVSAEGSEELVRKVAAHMTHGENTARKYYRHTQGVEESVLAYQATAGTRKRKAEEESEEKENQLPFPTLKKRVRWLPEEEEEIRKSIDLQKTPTLEVCGAFLALKAHDDGNLFQGRTPKEVQDKCRTIRKQLTK